MTMFDIFANQRQVWTDYKQMYTLARRATPFVVGVIVGGFIFSSDLGYVTNLYTEMLSIIATVGILNFFNQQREISNLKRRIIGEASSQSNETAKSAVDWIRREGWLTVDDGLLREADLQGANLECADLTDANLEQANATGSNLKESMLISTNLKGAQLVGANLEQANLTNADVSDAVMVGVNLQYARLWNAHVQNTEFVGANLAGAELSGANLQQTNLGGVNLEDAKLIWSNLQMSEMSVANLRNANLENANLQQVRLCDSSLRGAILVNANLSSADLGGADLLGANLRGAIVDNVIWQYELYGMVTSVTLPDGTLWSDDTDITRFTDPTHPDFWQPVDTHLLQTTLG